jgi:GH15 family glucan-1,4-alpha-glucosidase
MHLIQLAAVILTASVEALASRVHPVDGAVSICHDYYDGNFEVTINKLSKRDIEVRNRFTVFHPSLIRAVLISTNNRNDLAVVPTPCY